MNITVKKIIYKKLMKNYLSHVLLNFYEILLNKETFNLNRHIFSESMCKLQDYFLYDCFSMGEKFKNNEIKFPKIN